MNEEEQELKRKERAHLTSLLSIYNNYIDLIKERIKEIDKENMQTEQEM